MSEPDSNPFHDHLDVCEQCEKNPAFLCPIGALALRQTVGELPGVTLDPLTNN